MDVLRLSFTEGLDLICNEEGMLIGLPPTIAWVEEGNLLEIIIGNCFVCRHTDEGDFTSIKESDIAVIQEKLKEVDIIINNTVYLKQK